MWLRNAIKARSPGASLPRIIQDLLPLRAASAMRAALKETISPGTGCGFHQQLFEEVGKAGWSEIERDRLAAYVDFYSGNVSAAYERVVGGRLAETDYHMLITACAFCYRYDRFREGYALVKQFRPEFGEISDQSDYFAFAGYLALAAGAGIDAAVGYFDQALDLGLSDALLVVNAYPVYFEAGLHDRANQLRQLIHGQYSSDPDATFALAYVELARGYYPEGFRLLESRYDMPEAGRAINLALRSKRRWTGEQLRDMRLLVHCEQGYGDTIMMARYFSMLSEMAASVVIDTRDAAVSLLAANFPACEVVAGGDGRLASTKFDCWVGAMSLPYLLGTSRDSVPFAAGYLRTPDEHRAYWRQRVVQGCGPGNRPRIGLAWAGNPSHRADARRSIPFVTLLPYLLASDGVRFFSLQTAVPSHVVGNLVVFSDELTTLADTAALIEQMDLVITVDTSIVHLAGAMGKPTWLLLPYRYEWRWGLEGEANKWYETVRVLRQAKHGDWMALLAEVFGRRLQSWLANRWEA